MSFVPAHFDNFAGCYEVHMIPSPFLERALHQAERIGGGLGVRSEKPKGV